LGGVLKNKVMRNDERQPPARVADGRHWKNRHLKLHGIIGQVVEQCKVHQPPQGGKK
jgi:hypothetical protein